MSARPDRGVAADRIIPAFIAKAAHFLVDLDQCQAFPAPTSRVDRQQPTQFLKPGAQLRARLVKKTLFVGVFAYLSNWNNLAKIVFDSFAGLGLKASGTGFTAQDLMRPGKVAQTGLDAARPLLESISDVMGWVAFFENFIQIACLLFAWALVILAFFILSIQLFVTLIELKLITLGGFVLIPFGLFGKTAFMAERVLGNIISSGIKVLVLAVIIGIGLDTIQPVHPRLRRSNANYRRSHGRGARGTVTARPRYIRSRYRFRPGQRWPAAWSRRGCRQGLRSSPMNQASVAWLRK